MITRSKKHQLTQTITESPCKSCDIPEEESRNS